LAKFKEVRKKFLNNEYIWKKSQYDSVRCHHAMTQNHQNSEDKYSLQVPKCHTGRPKRSYNSNCEMFQAESVRSAAFGCDWVGTPIQFQRCLTIVIATANKGFHLTAGKFFPVSNLTMMNVGRINFLHYFFTGRLPPIGPGFLRVEGYLSHSDTPHSVGRSGRAIRPTQVPLPDNTQHFQEKEFHDSCGIRIRHPTKRTAAKPVFRPRDHRDLLTHY